MLEQRDDSVWVNGRPVKVPEGSARVGDGPRVVVRVAGPITTALTRRLESAGHIEFWCPPSGVCLTLRGKRSATSLTADAAVSGFVPYDEGQCHRGLRRPSSGPGRRWLDVVCFSSRQRPAVARRLRGLGAEVLAQSSCKVRIDWPGDPAPIRDLVGVKLVERPRPARVTAIGLASDIGYATDMGAWQHGLDGRGEIVAVADTGLDTGDLATLLPDIAGRVVSLVSWPLDPSWSPYVTNPGAVTSPIKPMSGR